MCCQKNYRGTIPAGIGVSRKRFVGLRPVQKERNQSEYFLYLNQQASEESLLPNPRNVYCNHSG